MPTDEGHPVPERREGGLQLVHQRLLQAPLADRASHTEVVEDVRVSITAPTSIVHGDQDPIYPLGHGEALVAVISGAVLHVVPGMGHVMTSPGLPEEVADVIRL